MREKINVAGLSQLRFAVVNQQDYVVSLHQHPDGAETARRAYRLGDEFHVVELLDPIGYKQY